MNTQLKSSTLVRDSSGNIGLLLGIFTRQGEKWWTVHWEKSDTAAHKEVDIRSSMEILS